MDAKLHHLTTAIKVLEELIRDNVDEGKSMGWSEEEVKVYNAEYEASLDGLTVYRQHLRREFERARLEIEADIREESGTPDDLAIARKIRENLKEEEDGRRQTV